MFSKFSSKLILIIFVVITAGFYFGPAQLTNAQLPVEAGLGQDCDTATLCEAPFFCPAGVCVECESDTNCDERIGQSCIEGVCTNPGGNNADDLCVGDSNCKSGTKCGAAKTCEDAGGGWQKAFNHSCQTINDCGGGLICSSTGRCVECQTMGDCEYYGSQVIACDQGICALKGGNPEGAWCAKDSHCASGECSEGNICQAGTGPIDDETGEDNWMGIDITIQDVENIINGLACWLTRIAMAIMVIFLILAGMRFMYARGNPTAYQSAVKNFQHVLIGILVIMAVYVIIATIANAVGRTDFSLIPLVC